MEDGQIVEGYICPNCFQTFPQSEILLKHFENDHSGQTDVLKTLQGIFTVFPCYNKLLIEE